MTKEQFAQKVNELMKEIQEDMLPNRIDKILKPGCIDLESAEDNYILPKAFMIAFVKEIAHQHMSRKDIQVIANNMSHFM